MNYIFSFHLILNYLHFLFFDLRLRIFNYFLCFDIYSVHYTIHPLGALSFPFQGLLLQLFVFPVFAAWQRLPVFAFPAKSTAPNNITNINIAAALKLLFFLALFLLLFGYLAATACSFFSGSYFSVTFSGLRITKN